MSGSRSSFDLSGQVALVTGASSGLGRHFAVTLAHAGAQVALAARRIDRLDSLANEIAGFGGRAMPVSLDVTASTSVDAAIGRVESELGRIVILINNAGIATTSVFPEQNETDWRKVLDTNLDGAWRVAHGVAQRMAEGGHGGSIINVVSILGLRPASRVSAYRAAKAVPINLAPALAIELARYGIRVNALEPGYVETDLSRGFLQGRGGQAMLKRVPLRRFGTAADLEGALLLLASDAGGYITGHVLVVDGGHLLSIA